MHAQTLAYQLELSNKILEMNTRNMALGSMGQQSPYPMKDFDPYDDRTGVPFSRENALHVDELRRRFKAMQEPLVNAITSMSPEVMAARPPRNFTGDPNETVGSNMATFVFHECYHVGQTGVLRRVVGKPGVVKPPEGR